MCLLTLPALACAGRSAAGEAGLVPTEPVRRLVERFIACDEGDVENLIPNSDSLEWILANAPLLDCPSARLQEVYYFRWWTFRKHIVQTPHGRVLTEFLTPVSHAGPHNTVSCAVGHHIAEGRWLRDQGLLDEYLGFWLHSGPDGGPAPHYHKFSNWNAAALYDRYLVTGDAGWLIAQLDALQDDFARWEAERGLPDGLFWQHDVKDGMEESISGGRRVKNVRPTITSYMSANARAIARIGALAGRAGVAREYSSKANQIRAALVESMWNPELEFFTVRREDGRLSDAREAIGFIPWAFGLAGPEHAAAWRQLNDREGFWAPAGLTTAERRHPGFRSHGVGTCEWDGAVWPFATSQTLTGMANLLRGESQPYVTRRDYFEQLLRYAQSHQQDGVAYIGEYHDEVTGDWLITGPKAKRSRYYNHSTFNDLVIRDLVGVVPSKPGTVLVSPLLPPDAWDWFCLENLRYQNHDITVVWDRDGQHYGRGAGLSVFCDGERIANLAMLAPISAKLPPLPETPEP